jgi:colanic acid/amylovoran biosynthesis glycosyltransferase
MTASGLPIISTNHCDIPHVVLDGTTGLLADERKAEQLRIAILQLAADDSPRLQMGRRGREHVAEHFCARRQGHKLAELYREVLDGDKVGEGIE